jgi:hypothetical protein
VIQNYGRVDGIVAGGIAGIADSLDAGGAGRAVGDDPVGATASCGRISGGGLLSCCHSYQMRAPPAPQAMIPTTINPASFAGDIFISVSYRLPPKPHYTRNSLGTKFLLRPRRVPEATERTKDVLQPSKVSHDGLIAAAPSSPNTCKATSNVSSKRLENRLSYVN